MSPASGVYRNVFAPGIATHEPAPAQRCQWYTYRVGDPAHNPAVAVRVCPACAVPEIVGGREADGRDPDAGLLAAIATVGGDTATAAPPSLLARIRTDSARPASAARGRYVSFVAVGVQL